MRHAILLVLFVPFAAFAAEPGYFRQPAIHGDTVVFVAEGDLWKVPITGGDATRLTTHPGDEGMPAISPDGQTIAFTAQYEGPTEVYTMPLAGGRPERRTWDGGRVTHVGWAGDNRLLISTNVDSTLPSQQLVTIDLGSRDRRRIPLAQAAEGTYLPDGAFVFTRLPFQGSQCKNYRGGTVQQLWRYKHGDSEARLLTGDYKGTSKNPIALGNRICFLTDRSGTMNLWSMTPDGQDFKPLTRHEGFDVISASGHGTRIVYQYKADLRTCDWDAGKDYPIRIKLNSDFDHTREKVIAKPVEWLATARISPNGDRVALTARGKVFVAPAVAGKGRFLEISRKEGVRYRDARFMPDGKSLLTLSDESGEVEFWKLPAAGSGKGERLTSDGSVLRWNGVPSPNGRYIAHDDKDQRLWIYDSEKKSNKKIAESPFGDSQGFAWSPDSQWLAYAVDGENQFRRVYLHHIDSDKSAAVTTDRYDSFSPAWSADGKFLYFLSNRNLSNSVPGPWGIYAPEPFFDKKTRIYHVGICDGLRSPFAPKDDTLEPEPAKKDVELAGIDKRIFEVPIPPGNYTTLAANDKGLFWMAHPLGGDSVLQGAAFGEKPTPSTIATDARNYEMSKEGNKLLIRFRESLNVSDATPTSNAGAPSIWPRGS